jgi:thiosulfate/3-mercaptopyruvate sulfurtransferase
MRRHPFHRLLSATLLGTAVAPSLSTAQPTAAPVVVRADWLQPRLREPGVALLHVANARAEYDAGHIPGARYLPFPSIAVSSGGLGTQMAPVAVLDSILESLGVTDDSHVVLYGQALAAARAFVTMEYVGLKGRVSVLDGGIDAWRESGRPISYDAAAPTRGSFTPHVDSSVVVDHAWIQARGAATRVKILDARAPEFYLGYSPGQMPRAGHIPHASNVPFSSLTTELTQLRDEGTVRKLFQGAAVAAGDTVVTYCHVGLQASLLYLSARRLGHVARIYDGSFEDWSKRPELPLTNRAAARQ